MKTYISILRGINVGGKKKIIMAELAKLYEELKFLNVTTYIQSGNVIFNSDSNISNKSISELIVNAIVKKYAFDVPVLVRAIDEFENIIKLNPFISQKDIDLEKLHVTFLEDEPAKEKTDKIKSLDDFSPDKFIIIEKEIYLYCPVDNGSTKLSNIFFESKLKVKATTRNWKTVNKLFELAALKQA